MYDPESNIRMENYTKEARERTNNMRKKYGETNPLVKAAELIDHLMEISAELHNDYDNCFNEDKKENIERELNEIYDTINIIREDMAKAIKRINKK